MLGRRKRARADQLIAVKNNFSKSTLPAIALISMMAIAFFSCKRSRKTQAALPGKHEPVPYAEIHDFTAHYTLKGQIAMTLQAPELLDYSQYEFARQIFPKGMHIVIHGKDGDKTYIEAKRAAVYKPVELVELIGQVHIYNDRNEELVTDRLFWDKTRDHIFTDDSVRFSRNNEYIKGRGFDSNMSFTSARVNNISGIISINKKP